MKKILTLFALAALLLTSCEQKPEKDPTPKPGEYKVKLIEAPQPVSIMSSATAAESRTIGVECITEGFKTPINISFAVEPSLVPAGAVMLPADAFTLSDVSATIQPGVGSAEVTVSVSAAASLQPSTRYVVPIALSCDSEYVELKDNVVYVEVSMTLAPYEVQVKSATVDAVALNSSDIVPATRTIEIQCTNSKMYGQASVAVAVDANAVPAGKTLLPESAYSLPTTITIDPDTKEGAADLSIIPSAKLVPGTTYVLPLCISSSDSGVNIISGKSQVAVEVSFTKYLGAIPITGPEGGVSACAEFFVMQDKYLITRNGTTGEVLRFEYNAANRTLGPGTVIGTGWTSTAVRLFGPGPGNTIHYVADNIWYVQKLPDDCSSIKPFDDASKTRISSGCSIFLFQLYGVHSAGMVFINRATGSLFLYPTSSDGMTLSGGKTDTDSDGETFNFWKANYRFVFIFKDDVYGIGPIPGTLYRHKYNPETKTFSRERTAVGENWAQFLQITQLGDDLVVQKGNATLDIYQFDPDNYTWDADFVPAS